MLEEMKKYLATDCHPRHGDKTDISHQVSPYLYAVHFHLCPYSYMVSYTVCKQTSKKLINGHGQWCNSSANLS